MSCLLSPNTTVAGNFIWSQVSGTLSQNLTCGTTYLRPDVGGALMPWLFTVLQIIIHLPVIIVRVAHWEDVQTLSVVLAAFNVGIVSQAFAATKLAAEDVLVWSPMTLVLDAGAMLQLLILVRADHPNWMQDLRDNFRKSPGDDSSENENEMQPHANPPPPPAQHPPASHPFFVAFIITTSFALFLVIFGLQITGLVAAFKGHKKEDIKSSWCSPMFALFGIAELDLNCIFHPITGNPHKGIGCIELPGTRQRSWLMVTIISVILSVVIEGIDFVILCFVPRGSKWWVVKLKRPWFTMVFGLVVLVLILAYGTSDAYSLPQGITEKIWLVVDGTQPFVCAGNLTPAGLRGQFLGWLDGLLQVWNTTYFGR